MRHALSAALLFSLLASPALAQKKKPKPPPEPPKRTCEDGSTAADDGSCPEDFIRKCEDGNPAADDGSCPEDIPPEPIINFYDASFEVKANLDLAEITVDDQTVGQAPYVGQARLSEGPHIFSVTFPGFEPFNEDIAVFPDMPAIKREVKLVPLNDEAKTLLSSQREIEKFLDSGLTVDSYVAYGKARQIKRIGLFTLIGGGAAFAAFITTRVTLENQDSPAITLPFTAGVIALAIGTPTFLYGRYKVQKAQSDRRDSDFLRKPPAPKELDELPTKPKAAPASAPASAPAPSAVPVPVTTP